MTLSQLWNDNLHSTEEHGFSYDEIERTVIWRKESKTNHMQAKIQQSTPILTNMHAAYTLTNLLAAIMGLQALTGLLFPEQYRDVEWAKIGWLGNDGLTLLIAMPLLALSAWLAMRGSVRAYLVWLGSLGFALYNYVFYLFGAELNIFYVFYLAAPILVIVILILLLKDTQPHTIKSTFRSQLPEKVVGGYFIFFGSMLLFVWLQFWARYIFAQDSLPIEPAAFKVIASADILLIIPLALYGGTLLWRGSSWGYIVTAMVGVQGTIYILVLIINSMLMIQAEIAEFPGELPIWTPLWCVTTAFTAYLYTHIKDQPISKRD